MLELQEIGIPVTYSQYLNGMILSGTYSFESSQLATMGTAVEELNQKLAAKQISKKEYEQNIENLRKMFNVPIRDYIY